MPAPQVVALGETMAVFAGVLPHIGAALGFSFAGAESTVCLGLARLGHRTRWLSALGDDVFGRAIAQTLRGEGVDVEATSFSASALTGVMFKLRRALAEPNVAYYRAGSAFSRLESDAFEANAWREADVLHLSGITPALSPSCRELWLRAALDAHENGVRVWLDPNFRSKLWSRDEARDAWSEIVPFCDFVLPGLGEGEILTGQSEPRAIAEALLERGAKNVVVKAAERGATWFDADSSLHAPPFEIERVVDPIGAGDGFAAGLLSGVLDGLERGECLRRAHAVGAMVCGGAGDWEPLPRREELEAFLAGNRESQR